MYRGMEKQMEEKANYCFGSTGQGIHRIAENQMEKKVEHDMETWNLGFGVYGIAGVTVGTIYTYISYSGTYNRAFAISHDCTLA